MPQFRKKPVVIEAIQFTGHNGFEIRQFSNNDAYESPVLEPTDDNPTGAYFQIRTLEGTMIGKVNDWIIKGINGEFYPCKPDIFDKTYEPASKPLDVPAGEVKPTLFVLDIAQAELIAMYKRLDIKGSNVLDAINNEHSRLASIASLPSSNPIEQVKDDGWISVEDQLPDDENDKHVWIKGEMIPFVCHHLNKKYFLNNYDDDNYMEEGWYLSHSYNLSNEGVQDVTHWRPLPPPPPPPTDK